VLGLTGINVVGRVSGIVLATLAAELFLDGARQALS
jgi:small neutral amino acid transporter SnatA (MarC family)